MKVVLKCLVWMGSFINPVKGWQSVLKGGSTGLGSDGRRDWRRTTRANRCCRRWKRAWRRPYCVGCTSIEFGVVSDDLWTIPKNCNNRLPCWSMTLKFKYSRFFCIDFKSFCKEEHLMSCKCKKSKKKNNPWFEKALSQVNSLWFELNKKNSEYCSKGGGV
jgi:hypothetical protein